MELIKTILLFDVFPFLCRLMGSVCVALALYAVGFPPIQEVSTTSLSLGVLGTFFLLLPVAKKISLGKLLTFEREVQKVREETRELRAETKEILGVYGSMVSAISNTVKQTVNVHFHREREEAQKAKEALQEVASSVPENEKAIESEVFKFIASSGDDHNFALARIRMDIEKQLREVLGKRTTTSDPTQVKSGFLSARQLFSEFIKRHPKYENMHFSLDYVLKVCNAAIHGQQVSEGHASEAIGMGLSIIEEIKGVGATQP